MDLQAFALREFRTKGAPHLKACAVPGGVEFIVIDLFPRNIEMLLENSELLERLDDIQGFLSL